MLLSGLLNDVSGHESLARFLVSSNHYNAQMAKPSAFLPSPKDHETSVFRHGSEPRQALWAIGDRCVAGARTIHGAAIVKAAHVRSAGLDVFAQEPPPRHAAIRNWPWLDDPQLQKAQKKERAAQVAGQAMLIPR